MDWLLSASGQEEVGRWVEETGVQACLISFALFRAYKQSMRYCKMSFFHKANRKSPTNIGRGLFLYERLIIWHGIKATIFMVSAIVF